MIAIEMMDLPRIRSFILLPAAVKDAASDAWNGAKKSLGFGGGNDSAAAKAAPKPAPALEARARGGPVRGNVPYLVGERGPEIFVPNSSGNVETNATYQKLASLGSSGGTPAMRAPSADAMAQKGATTSSGGSSKSIRVGDMHVNLTIQGGGGNSDDLARKAEAAVRRVLAQYESEQRGLLSD